MWKKIGRWFSGAAPPSPGGDVRKEAALEQLPEVRWLPDSENTWGVPVLDVRAVTQGLLSTSRDPPCAANAISFIGDDGRSFASLAPKLSRITEASLEFPADGLIDGALFIPRVMEEKWAIYLHSGRLLCIRSWTRTLLATAQVNVTDRLARFGRIQGAFVDEREEPQFTVRALEYLLRSHALGEVFPAPLPAPPDDLKAAALWCFSCYGRRAPFAAAVPPLYRPPSKPLRTAESRSL
jgi:hypothetical protein